MISFVRSESDSVEYKFKLNDSLETGLTIKQVEHAVVRLKGMDILVREGTAKTGTWKIFKYDGGNKSEVKGDEFSFVSENKVHYEPDSDLKNVRGR